MLDLHNVVMTEEPKKLDLTKNACGIRNVSKDITNLLDCNFFPELGIICRADNTVASFADYFLYSVSPPLIIFPEKIYIRRCLHTNIKPFMNDRKQMRTKNKFRLDAVNINILQVIYQCI